MLSAFVYFVNSTIYSYGIVEYGEKRHTLFEWAENGDLETYLDTFPNLPWSFKIKVAWEISSALSHCHRKGILHHDVRR